MVRERKLKTQNKDHFDARQKSHSEATLDSHKTCTVSLGMFPNLHNALALNVGTSMPPQSVTILTRGYKNII